MHVNSFEIFTLKYSLKLFLNYFFLFLLLSYFSFSFFSQRRNQGRSEGEDTRLDLSIRNPRRYLFTLPGRTHGRTT